MKYRKKTVEIEAIQWQGEQSFDELYEFMDADNHLGIVGMKGGQGDIAQIRTLGGVMDVQVGDYVIKDSNGGFYPCESNTFNETYENVFED